MNRSWLAAGAVALALCGSVGCGCSKDSGQDIVVQNGTVMGSGGSKGAPSSGSGKPTTGTAQTQPTPNPSLGAGSPASGTNPPATAGTSPNLGSKHSKVPPPDLDGKWIPDSEPPMDLAKTVDEKVAGLNNAAARVTVFYQDIYGTGETKSFEAMQGNRSFHLEYPILLDQKENDMTTAVFIADGKVATMSGVGGLKMRQPAASVKVSTKIPLDQWAYSFPQIVFTPICGGRPLEDLVAEAQKPDSGAKVSSEKVSFDYQGKTFRQQRFRIDKTVAGQAPISLTITVDSTYDLPVTIEAKGGKSADKLVYVKWTAGWNFHPHLPFKPSLFTVPSPAELPKDF